MGENKTGMEKFMNKQFSQGVKIGAPAGERGTRERVSHDREQNAEEKSQGKSRVGRPRKEGGQEQATVIIKIDRELKRKLEEVKYVSYKSTLKDVLVEAMNDVIRKYGVE